MSAWVTHDPNDIRAKSSLESDSTYVSDSQRSDWIFSSQFGDASVASFRKVHTVVPGVTKPSTMTLKEVPTTGASGTNPIS